MAGEREIEHAASEAGAGVPSGPTAAPVGLALGERDLVRRARANYAVLVAAIERRHRLPLPTTRAGDRDKLGKRLRQLCVYGLVPPRHARAMFAALDLRNDVDYRGAAPAALAARIAEHRAVAAWAIARGYLRADQLEPVEPAGPPAAGHRSTDVAA